jgi:hypothetical protein
LSDSLRQDREILERARSHGRSRQKIKFRSDLRLKFKELSPKELAEFKEKIRAEAKRKKRIQNTILISIFALSLLSAVIIRVLGGFN